MSLIVVVEDNAQNARMVDKLLRNAGHDVIVAEDGEGGINSIVANRPDLALVDLGLPDMDGQTVVAMVRQEPELDAMPIIAFTAYPEDAATSMAEAYGCDGVIVKPIDTRTFARQVEEFLKPKRK
jgi:two-component system, cell cycle response regulator DivK